MLRLAKNDIVANGVTLFGLFLLLNAGLVSSFTTRVFHPESCVLLAGLIAIVSPLPILLRSEMYKSAALYRSLPIQPVYTAGAKYLSVVSTIAATVLYTLIYLFIVDSVNHPTLLFETLYRIRFTLLAEAMYGAIILAVGIPLAIRFGSFMRIMWSVIFFIVVHNYAFFSLRRAAIRIVNVAGFGETILVLVALTVVLSAISLLVSTRLLRAREF